MKTLINRFFLVLIVICFIDTDASAYNSGNGLNKSLTSYPVQVYAGWNLMSVPVNVADGTKNVLYPSSSSQAYAYDQGYISKDTLETGTGYWLKFSSSQTIFIEGDTVLQQVVNVQKGWNMIGSISVPVDVNTVLSEPAGIISSNYYNYVPGSGYQQADTIQPGRGYWIKVNQTGMLLLTAPGTGGNNGISDSVRSIVLDSVNARIDALPGDDPMTDNVILLNYLRSVPEFAASDTIRGGVWARFTDGRMFIYDNIFDTSAALSKPHLQTPSTSNRRNDIVSLNDAIPLYSGAWIVNSLGSAFDYSGVGQVGFTKTVNDLRQWHQSVGYTPASNAGASVGDLKFVKNVGVFYMSAHGHFAKNASDVKVYGLWTSTEKNDFYEALYEDDFNNDRLIYYSAAHERGGLFSSDISKTHYAITSKFVTKYMNFAPNSVVFINACSSFDVDFREAFFTKGADVYFGWTKPVNPHDAVKVARRFFDRALGTNKQNPENPPQRPFDLQLCVEDIILEGMSTSMGPDGPSVFSFYPIFPYTNLLAPSILQGYQLPISGFDDFEIDGLFGDPAPGQAVIKVGGDALGIREWVNSTKFKLDPPTHGGNVEVTVRGRKSNVTQYTQWHAVFDYTLTGRGSLKQHIVMNVDFLADVHSFRLNIRQAPVFPFSRFIQVLNTSYATYECSGEYRDPEDTAFVEEWWTGSGTVPFDRNGSGFTFGSLIGPPGNANPAGLGFSAEYFVNGFPAKLGLVSEAGNVMLTMNSSFVVGGGSVSGSNSIGNAVMTWGDITPLYPPDPNGAR